MCDHLSKVQLRIVPPARGGPVRYFTALFRGKEYSLRLTPGFDAETTELMSRTGQFHKAMEYDFDSEMKAVRDAGITPRHIFGSKQWLVYALGHGTREGFVKDDRWFCFSTRPWRNEKGEAGVRVADGFGGTVGYSLRETAGPFLDNYTLARVMKRHGVKQLDLWPPVTSAAYRDVQPRVNAEEIPDNPRDYGSKALPAQPLSVDAALRDWVVYTLEDRFLCVGTRHEFGQPLKKREVLWSGMGEEPAKKSLLAPAGKEVYYSRRQALRALCEGLTELRYAFHPLADPRETVTARFRGAEKVHLALARGGDPDTTLEVRYGGYDLPGTLGALHEVDPNLTPRKTFGQRWLIHATGHGTYYGPVKDDFWLLYGGKPEGGKFTMPDGMGGTFGYSCDKVEGPFEDNYGLVPVLRALSKEKPALRSIGIWGENRAVSVDEVPEGITPTDQGGTPRPPAAAVITGISPPAAVQGQTLGITLLGLNLEPGCRLSLGKGTTVSDPVALGRDADTDSEQWVATVEIAPDAAVGRRALVVLAPDGSPLSASARSARSAPAASLEIKKAEADQIPPIALLIPAGARQWISSISDTSDTPDASDGVPDGAADAQALKKRRDDLFGALAAMETARDHCRGYQKDLARVQDELAALDPLRRREAYRKKAIEVSALSALVRQEETEYARGMAAVAVTFTEEEAAQLAGSLRARVSRLAEKTRGTLDEARAWNYVTYWEDWRIRKRLYDVAKDDLLHTLRVWQNFNAVREAKLSGLIRDARLAQAAERGSVDNPAALRPYQRALRDVHLDMGLCGLYHAQAMVEDGLASQETYLACFKATAQQAGSIEEAKEFRGRAEQGIVFGLKYALALGGDGFLSASDCMKRLSNATVGELTGLKFDHTVTGGITTALAEGRQKLRMAHGALERVRGYSDEQTIALRGKAPEDYQGDQGLSYLAQDLNYVMQSGGGLVRLAACYGVALDERLEDELRIAMGRARLTTADMRRTFNAMRGATSNDQFTNAWRAIVSPFGLMKTLLQGTSLGGDQFTGTEVYLQDRESEVQEMDGLLLPFQKARWDPEELRARSPSGYATYLALRQNNPSFLQWDLARDELTCQDRLEQIERRMRVAWEEHEDESFAALARQKSLNQYDAAAHVEEMARMLQLQGCDRLMVWDYDGSLECFHQASEISEKVQPRAKVEALRDELSLRKTKEARLEVIFSLGDVVFMSRVYAGIARGFWSRAQRAGLVSSAPKYQPPPPVRSFLSRPIPYVSAIGDAVWGGINPFKDILSAAAVEREWAAIASATAGAGVNVGQNVAAEVVRTVALEAVPVRPEVADFLGYALTSIAAVPAQSFAAQAARGLVATNRAYPQEKVDTTAYRQRGRARRTLSDYWTYQNWLRKWKQATEKLHGKSLSGKPPQEILSLTALASAAKQSLMSILYPLRAETARARLKQIEEAPPAERLARMAAFFKEYPLLADGGPVRRLLKGMKDANDPEFAALNERIDQMRWEVLSTAMERFLAEPAHQQFRELFLNYVFIGAAANRQGKAYAGKKCLTDVDFTALLKETATNAQRAQFEKAFNQWFENTHGITLEHLDVSVMGDFRPTFLPRLESLAQLLDVKDPAELKRLQEALERDAERVRVDAFHSERYYDVGSILFLNLGIRIVGNLKTGKRQGNDMESAAPEKVQEFFEGITLEPWMAFDVAMGQMGFLMRHRTPRRSLLGYGEPVLNEHGRLVVNDPVEYHKYLCKYPGTRGLFGLLLLSPEGRGRLAKLTKADAEAHNWESMEEVVVHVAKSILAEKGPGELGLPLLPGCDAAASRGRYEAMFDMWLLAKSGAKPEQVAARWNAADKGRPARVEDVQALANKNQVDAILTEHIRLTEAFTRRLISRSLVTQAGTLKTLEKAAAAAREAGTPEGRLQAQVYQAQMKRIFFRLASTWFRMKREVHDQVLREAVAWVTETPGMQHAESDFFYAIAALMELGPRVERPGAGEWGLDPQVLATWEPAIYRYDDEALKKTVEDLRRRSREAAGPPLLDSMLQADRGL